MGPRLDLSTRWCPVCEERGVPIIWGDPSADAQELAAQGEVIIAGCVVSGMYPSHVCADCSAEFIASSRIYQRDHGGTDVFGIGAWPHGRRSVRIEGHAQGWTVIVAGTGSMLIDRTALQFMLDEVFAEMWPWEVQEWANRRGFAAEVRPNSRGWDIELPEASGFFELTVVKAWWRRLGRNPVATALERLSSDSPAPLWLPQRRDPATPGPP